MARFLALQRENRSKETQEIFREIKKKNQDLREKAGIPTNEDEHRNFINKKYQLGNETKLLPSRQYYLPEPTTYKPNVVEVRDLCVKMPLKWKRVYTKNKNVEIDI
jgi:hypothetical protein